MLNFSKHFQIGIIRYHKLYRFCSSKTIFAVSSGQGKCAVSIIRISGKHTVNAMKLLNCYKTELPKPRTAVLRSIRHPVTNEILDKCLILWFPGPNCFTGEDSCELHVHGGIAVVNAVLTALSETPELSVAEPGDFTRRAFFNNKLDLTEVEGLADLLQAETEVQRKQAFLQTQGSLSKIYTKWKNDLLRSVAHIEAYIDFDETETIDVNIFNTCTKNIECLLQDIREHLKDGRKGEMLRNGVRTCIIGKPNVGKSSLMNLLCKRPAAIVTPIAGTTRDILEVTLNFDGYPLVLSDMAGLRKNTNDVIEQEGINKAIENCKTADLILVIIDSAEYMQWQLKNNTKDFNHYLMEYIESMNLNFLISSFKNGVLEFNKKSLIICNKVDKLETNVNHNGSNSNIFISCKTNSGIGHLVSAITDQLKTLCGNPSKEHPSMNQIRHRQHLTDCANSLQLFIEKSNNQNNTDLVLLVEYLRIAVKHLEKLLGKITTDEVLNIIFKDFCIGK